MNYVWSWAAQPELLCCCASSDSQSVRPLTTWQLCKCLRQRGRSLSPRNTQQSFEIQRQRQKQRIMLRGLESCMAGLSHVLHASALSSTLTLLMACTCRLTAGKASRHTAHSQHTSQKKGLRAGLGSACALPVDCIMLTWSTCNSPQPLGSLLSCCLSLLTQAQLQRSSCHAHCGRSTA